MPPPGDGRGPCPVAGRPAAAEPAGRRHRQHPSRRDLHRQALFAGRADRAAGAGRVPRLRDAAGPADEPRPAADDPGADRAAVGAAGDRAADALGHGAARPLHAAAFRLGGLPRRAARSRRARLRRAARRGSRRRPSSASRSAARSRWTGSASSCGRRWSPGTCSARPGRSAGRCAIPTARSSGCRSSSPPPIRRAMRSPATGGGCRCSRPGPAGWRWRGCASRRGSRPRRCIR